MKDPNLVWPALSSLCLGAASLKSPESCRSRSQERAGTENDERCLQSSVSGPELATWTLGALS